MKLAAFITTNLEQILEEWDVFAKTLFPANPGASELMLRDHAREILQEVAQDIETSQSPEQQTTKSRGESPQKVDPKSAAGIHGTVRHNSGFTLVQLTSEYRALRATVFRLWMPQMEPVTQDVVQDITRFNEAIDEALAESVMTYSGNADRTRDTFLAILGHDLRSPLHTMNMAGRYLSKASIGNTGTQQMGARVLRSAANMSSMVSDLLEYARTQLGGDIPLTRQRVDVLDICQAALEDAQAGHPDCPFDLQASGNLVGEFDGPRLQQIFSNLLNNAAQYGAPSEVGKTTMNSLSRPKPSLITCTMPPWSSTSARTIDKPIPRPPSERSSVPVACVNKSKMKGCSSGSIPTPRSFTETATMPFGRICADNAMVSVCREYLLALRSRLEKTCDMRTGSPLTMTDSCGKSMLRVWPWASREGRAISTACSTISARSRGLLRKVILPVRTRDASSKSSSSRFMWLTCRTRSSWICGISGCEDVSLPSISAARPIGASGLRSSWASMAKNSFCRRLDASARSCRSRASSDAITRFSLAVRSLETRGSGSWATMVLHFKKLRRCG